VFLLVVLGQVRFYFPDARNLFVRFFHNAHRGSFRQLKNNKGDWTPIPSHKPYLRSCNSVVRLPLTSNLGKFFQHTLHQVITVPRVEGLDRTP